MFIHYDFYKLSPRDKLGKNNNIFRQIEESFNLSVTSVMDKSNFPNPFPWNWIWYK